MSEFYEIRKGSGERTWFVSFEKNEFWVWEPNKELGLYGDDKTFLTSEGPITVIGPWFGSRASMEKECESAEPKDWCSGAKYDEQKSSNPPPSYL